MTILIKTCGGFAPHTPQVNKPHTGGLRLPDPLLYTPQTLKTLIPNFNVIATASYLLRPFMQCVLLPFDFSALWRFCTVAFCNVAFCTVVFLHSVHTPSLVPLLIVASV